MKRNGATAIVLVALMTVAFTGMASAVSDNSSPNAGGNGAGGENGNGDRPDNPGSFMLNQSVVFGEKVVFDGTNYAIYMDGSLLDIDVPYYNVNYPKTLPMYSEDVVVQADWSDNLVLHTWDAGDKIRTEVILQSLADPSVAVFTIRAAFLIEVLNEDGLYDEIWSGTTEEGLWVDGPTDVYSAEVNQLGMLLYGYNWDTDGCLPGQYRLTFTLADPDTTSYPNAESPAFGADIVYSDITIDSMVDPGLHEEDENYALVDAGCDSTTTWIEIMLE
jgi:hypothetical protein